jgi:hypothetical protein
MLFRLTLRLCTLILVYFSLLSTNAQNNMDAEVEKIKNLGKDSIIQLAKKLIDTKYAHLQVDFKDYDISVWYNSKGVHVKLKRIVRYTPLRYKGTKPPFYDTNISFDLWVDMLNRKSNPISTWSLEDFFIPTKEDKENLAFVDKQFGLHQEHFDTEVYEEENHFSVQVDNDVAFGRYFIDKGTGKQTIPPMQGSYDPNPIPDFNLEDDPDRMVEMIK